MVIIRTVYALVREIRNNWNFENYAKCKKWDFCHRRKDGSTVKKRTQRLHQIATTTIVLLQTFSFSQNWPLYLRIHFKLQLLWISVCVARWHVVVRVRLTVKVKAPNVGESETKVGRVDGRTIRQITENNCDWFVNKTIRFLLYKIERYLIKILKLLSSYMS